jgi:hypothetical protein
MKRLQNMNTKEISQYARTLINEALNTYTVQTNSTKGIYSLRQGILGFITLIQNLYRKGYYKLKVYQCEISVS